MLSGNSQVGTNTPMLSYGQDKNNDKKPTKACMLHSYCPIQYAHVRHAIGTNRIGSALHFLVLQRFYPGSVERAVYELGHCVKVLDGIELNGLLHRVYEHSVLVGALCRRSLETMQGLAQLLNFLNNWSHAHWSDVSLS